MAEKSLVRACERLESGDETLRELEIYRVDVRLVHALSRRSHLESLQFFDVDLGHDLVDALAKQTQLTTLMLSDVRLSDGAASCLAAALREMTRLEVIKLKMDNADEDDVMRLVVAIGKLPQLQTLKLGGHAIAACIRALVEMVVVQGRLRELDLSWSRIGQDGAAQLAAMLEQNRSLLVLSLSRCELGGPGLERLGRALTRNTTLRKLNVSDNNLSTKGVAVFAAMMGDMHGLQVLHLNERWEELLPGIERNYSLLELPGFSAARPYLERNARGYGKARDATLAWLCACRCRRRFGLPPEIGLIIAHLVYASRGHRCWADDGDKDGEEDSKRARRTK